MYKVAIDLTWLRHGVVGGTESYSINLIEGFISLNNKDIHYYLLTAKDNCYLFEKYSAYENITILKLDLNSTSKLQRILWHNLAMARLLNRNICMYRTCLFKTVYWIKKCTFYNNYT